MNRGVAKDVRRSIRCTGSGTSHAKDTDAVPNLEGFSVPGIRECSDPISHDLLRVGTANIIEEPNGSGAEAGKRLIETGLPAASGLLRRTIDNDGIDLIREFTRLIAQEEGCSISLPC